MVIYLLRGSRGGRKECVKRGKIAEVRIRDPSRRCLPLLFWTRCEVGTCGEDRRRSRTCPAKVAGRTNAFIACAEVFFSWTRLVDECTGSPALVEPFVLDNIQFIQSQVHSREFYRKLTGKDPVDLWPAWLMSFALQSTFALESRRALLKCQ